MSTGATMGVIKCISKGFASTEEKNYTIRGGVRYKYRSLSRIPWVHLCWRQKKQP